MGVCCYARAQALRAINARGVRQRDIRWTNVLLAPTKTCDNAALPTRCAPQTHIVCRAAFRALIFALCGCWRALPGRLGLCGVGWVGAGQTCT